MEDFLRNRKEEKLEAGEDDQKGEHHKTDLEETEIQEKYYFKIQAYKIVGGKKYSGKYSKNSFCESKISGD